jgi:gluconokinase
MGVSGAGKTTLAEALAERLGWRFQEGDALHPAANIAKMAAGRALDDADRWPWLDAVGAWIDGCVAIGRPGVITCSALKRAYRDRLCADRPGVRFAFIRAPRATIAARLERRASHFMPPGLLASQFEALEPPGPGEPVIVVDGHGSPSEQVDAVLDQLTEGGR